MNGLYSAALLLVFAASLNANETGAPDSACVHMTPDHGVDPKKGSLPYTVTASKTTVKSGEKIQITISGGVEKEFKGFLLQVRNSKDQPVGRFAIPSSNEFAKVLVCDSKNVAATHTSKDPKESVEVDWIAPARFSGKLRVYATVAKNGGEFWARHATAEINVI